MCIYKFIVCQENPPYYINASPVVRACVVQICCITDLHSKGDPNLLSVIPLVTYNREIPFGKLPNVYRDANSRRRNAVVGLILNDAAGLFSDTEVI